MNLTEAKRKKLIQKIIGPVMIEKGLSLRSNSNGIWVFQRAEGHSERCPEEERDPWLAI